MKKQTDVDVRVNPSCELPYKGDRWGAGAEIRMPVSEAIAYAKAGIVTLLVSAKENQKEAADASA